MSNKGRMVMDIRVRRGAPSNLKIQKLRRRFGWAGFGCLVNLWLYASDHAPDDGCLGVLSDEDLSIVSGYAEEHQERFPRTLPNGPFGSARTAPEPPLNGCAEASRGAPPCSVFGASLVELGLVERDESGQVWVHDWEEEQPYIAGARERQEAARRAGKASAEARRRKHGSAQPPRTTVRTAPERPFERSRTPDRTGPDRTGPGRSRAGAGGDLPPNEAHAQALAQAWVTTATAHGDPLAPGGRNGRPTQAQLTAAERALAEDPALADAWEPTLARLASERLTFWDRASYGRFGLQQFLRHWPKLEDGSWLGERSDGKPEERSGMSPEEAKRVREAEEQADSDLAAKMARKGKRGRG